MFNIGDYVVYKHDVCLIKELKKGRDDRDYYVLIPYFDNTLKIDIPIELANKSVRKLINKDYALDLIMKMSNIGIVDLDTKLLDGTHESLIKIIKTTYLRNKERIDSKRKVSDKDNYYFNLAEKYLYNELSIVLDKNYEDTKNFIISEVEENK